MRRFLGLGAFVLFGLLVIALPFTFILPPGPPDAASPTAKAINDIYWVALGAAAVVFLLIESALLLFIFRFRRRPGTPPEVEGPQVHGNTRLELAWTAIPALALAGLAIFTLVKAPPLQADPDGGGQPAAMRVRVEAHQFYWQYVYPNGAITLDVLRLPVNRPVVLELVSYDVVHSWWVPELAGKLDNVPPAERTNELSFTPERTGRFENGKCGEFCGIQHTLMTTSVEVVAQDEFDAWLERTAEEQGGGNVDLGRESYEAACAKCHGFEGEGDVGPAIAGNPRVTNLDQLRQLLLEGQDTETWESYMPPVGRGWPDHQYEALIAYVESNPTLSGEERGG